MARRALLLDLPTFPSGLSPGTQPETLVVFNDDKAAWEHYNRMYDEVRNSASDEIQLPQERIIKAEIEVSDTPVLSDASGTVVIETSPAAEARVSAPVQIERVEKVAAVLAPRMSGATPPVRRGRQTITPEIKREISRVRLVKSARTGGQPLSFHRQNEPLSSTVR